MKPLRSFKYQQETRKENIIRLRISDDMFSSIKTVAKTKGYSLSYLIRQAIRHYLKAIKSKK